MHSVCAQCRSRLFRTALRHESRVRSLIAVPVSASDSFHINATAKSFHSKATANSFNAKPTANPFNARSTANPFNARGLTHLAHKRKPARLQLSKDVAKPRLRSKDKTSKRADRNGPFAGMNRTRANIPATTAQDRLREMARPPSGRTKKDSKDPVKALKMQKSLADIGYGKRNAVKRQIEEITSFQDFPLLDSVQEALIVASRMTGTELTRPTPIQRLAIPALMGNRARKQRASAAVRAERKQFLLAAETGSGKTLAYLLPTLDAVKRQESEDAEVEAAEERIGRQKSLDLFDLEELEAEDRKIKAGRPRVVILVPTAELVDQVGKVCKSLAHTIKFRAAAISANYSNTVIRNRLFEPAGVDVLVTTPQLFANIYKSNPQVLSRISHLIIDEADSLLDKSFDDFTKEIIEGATPTLKQLIMCSATIPRKLDSYLRSHYPEALRLTTPNLHAIPRRVQLGVVDVEKGNFFGNKDLACADTIWNMGKRFGDDGDEDQAGKWDATSAPIKRVIVFVNEREKASELAAYLLSKGIDAIALTRDTEARQEKQLIAELTGSDPAASSSMSDAWLNLPLAKKLDQVRVLVTTDIASRGIDTTPVRDVVLYDVPHSTIDFIHRLGRTGRMGRRGRGIVLVGKGDRRDIVSEIRHEMFKGKALI